MARVFWRAGQSIECNAKPVIPGVAWDDVLKAPLFFALSQQKRIVAKLETLLPLCDRLK